MVSMTIDRRDGLNSSAAIKGPCRVATTANITLSGLQVIDGVQTVEGDRVLVRVQDDARDNGIRIVSTGNWERSADFRNNRDLATGTQVYVSSGTQNGGRLFSLTTTGSIAIGTSNITFTSSVVTQSELTARAPDFSANTMMVDNAAGTARETKTFAQVKTLLDIGAGSAIENRSTDTISPFDPAYGATGVGDDLAAIQAAWNAGSDGAKVVVMGRDLEAAGELTLKDNLTIVGRAGATLYQTDWSDIGAFMTNMDPDSTSVNSIKAGMHLRDVEASGELYPEPTYFALASGSTTTELVLGALDKGGNPVSTVDDFYNGRVIQVCSGAAVSGSLRFVSDYVGATKTLTLTSALSVAPSAGDEIELGYNDNLVGPAGGASDITIIAGKFTDMMPLTQVPPNAGGKGVNFEQGVTNSLLWGCTFRNLGMAVFVQGLDGVFTNGAKRRAVGIRVGGYYAYNVGSVLTIAGVNAAQQPDGDADDQLVVATMITYENAGHSPYRFVGTDQQKSGIINLLEGQNFSISQVSGRNDTTYPNTSPGYPTDYAGRVGYGLTGDVGAMIWGHSRNGTIRDFKHWGPVDCVWTVRRGRALGDDGQVTSGAGVSGRPGNVLGNRFTDIQLFGECARVIEVDPTAGFRVLNEELTGELQCIVDDVTSSIVDPNMSGYTNIIIDVTRRSDGKRVRGTPAQIILAGNQFDLLPEKETIFRQGRTYTIADDAVIRIVPPKKSGFVKFVTANGTSAASSNYAKVAYAIQGAATCELCYGPAALSLGTALLTDGTADGVDGNWNIAAVVSDALYLKNRRGSSRSIDVFFT